MSDIVDLVSFLEKIDSTVNLREVGGIENFLEKETIEIKDIFANANSSDEVAVDDLSKSLKTIFNVSSIELDKLDTCNNAIKSIMEKIPEPLPNKKVTPSQEIFFCLIQSIVKEEINIKIKPESKSNRKHSHKSQEKIKSVLKKPPLLKEDSQLDNLEKCKKICEDYVASLKKDLSIVWHEESGCPGVSQSHFQKLTREKIGIVREAIKALDHPTNSQEQKIYSFQEVLEKPENAKILASYRNHWAIEALKQVGSLFLINVYRMLVGTKGANLITILKQINIKNSLNEINTSTNHVNSEAVGNVNTK